MFVNPELHGKKRQNSLMKVPKKATREHEEAKRTLGSPRYHQKGWERVRELLTDKQGVAALRLYSFWLNISILRVVPLLLISNFSPIKWV